MFSADNPFLLQSCGHCGSCHPDLGKLTIFESEEILNFCFQGSVVVFTAWATWTNNYEDYAADVENKNYCAYEPMMYAFVILVTKWARIFFSNQIFI